MSHSILANQYTRDFNSLAIDSLRQKVIKNNSEFIDKMLDSAKYSAYTKGQIIELIDRHQPDILLNDIALPKKIDKNALIATYYNTVRNGVINNRLGQSAY